MIPRTFTAGGGDPLPHPSPSPAFGRARGASAPVLGLRETAVHWNSWQTSRERTSVTQCIARFFWNNGVWVLYEPRLKPRKTGVWATASGNASPCHLFSVCVFLCSFVIFCRISCILWPTAWLSGLRLIQTQSEDSSFLLLLAYQRIRGFAFMRYMNPRLIDWLIDWMIWEVTSDYNLLDFVVAMQVSSVRMNEWMKRNESAMILSAFENRLRAGLI